MLSPETNHKINDLRLRVMENVSNGRPLNTGISVEELRDAIGILRQSRAPMGSKGGKAAAESKRKAKPANGGQSDEEARESLRTKMAALGINLDD